MANQSVRLKEEQLRREEEKLREIELKVQREIQIKRQELLAKEDSLKVLEARLGMSNFLYSGVGLMSSFAKRNVMILTSVPFSIFFIVSLSCFGCASMSQNYTYEWILFS